jgi:hypothetical protein
MKVYLWVFLIPEISVISLNINQLIVFMGTCCILFEVQTELLIII